MEVHPDSEEPEPERSCRWLRLVARTPTDRALLAALYRALAGGGSVIVCPKGEPMRALRGDGNPRRGMFKIKGRRGR